MGSSAATGHARMHFALLIPHIGCRGSPMLLSWQRRSSTLVDCVGTGWHASDKERPFIAVVPVSQGTHARQVSIVHMAVAFEKKKYVYVWRTNNQQRMVARLVKRVAPIPVQSTRRARYTGPEVIVLSGKEGDACLTAYYNIIRFKIVRNRRSKPSVESTKSPKKSATFLLKVS